MNKDRLRLLIPPATIAGALLVLVIAVEGFGIGVDDTTPQPAAADTTRTEPDTSVKIVDGLPCVLAHDHAGAVTAMSCDFDAAPYGWWQAHTGDEPAGTHDADDHHDAAPEGP